MVLFDNKRSNDMLLDPFNENTWSDIEKLYFVRVDKFFARKVGDQFTNGNAAHAVYLITKFFEEAANEVRIFSGSLTRRASNGVQIYENPNLIGAVEDFLRRGGELRIVVQNEIDGGMYEHPLVKDFLNKDRYRLVRASERAISFLKEQKFLHHMMVMDEDAWRLETRTRLDGDGSLRSVEAIVSAFDKKSANSLKTLFDTVLLRDGKALTPA